VLFKAKSLPVAHQVPFLEKSAASAGPWS